MTKKQSSQRRKRGVYLSNAGWQRLQTAERRFEVRDNQGLPCTLEILSEKTGLSPNTITKVRRQQAAVDRQTLEIYFDAFGLSLTHEDCQTVDMVNSHTGEPKPVRGQVAIDSLFYINRPPLETMCYEAVQQPGALVHIRGTRQSGKTSLLAKTIAQVRDHGVTTVLLSLRLADTSVLQSPERFFRWFAAAVTRSLGLTISLQDHWDEVLGHSFNCTHYFEHNLLNEMDGPLVLALDDIESLLKTPEIAIDFFNMLRVWHELARYGDIRGQIWQGMRLVLVHSDEAFLSNLFLELPLNLGTPINMFNFDYGQVLDLVQRYGLEKAELITEKLMHFLDGKPSLTQLTLDCLSQQGKSLERLIESVLTPNSIFGDHLLQQLQLLQQHPDLLDSFKQVIYADQPINLPPLQTAKLCSLGLIDCHNQRVRPQCQLYKDYFNHVLL